MASLAAAAAVQQLQLDPDTAASSYPWMPSSGGSYGGAGGAGGAGGSSDLSWGPPADPQAPAASPPAGSRRRASREWAQHAAQQALHAQHAHQAAQAAQQYQQLLARSRHMLLRWSWEQVGACSRMWFSGSDLQRRIVSWSNWFLDGIWVVVGDKRRCGAGGAAVPAAARPQPAHAAEVELGAGGRMLPDVVCRL
jgi:hypothetical protein